MLRSLLAGVPALGTRWQGVELPRPSLAILLGGYWWPLMDKPRCYSMVSLKGEKWIRSSPSLLASGHDGNNLQQQHQNIVIVLGFLVAADVFFLINSSFSVCFLLGSTQASFFNRPSWRWVLSGDWRWLKHTNLEQPRIFISSIVRFKDGKMEMWIETRLIYFPSPLPLQINPATLGLKK